MEPDRIALWLFPPEDFAAWRKLVGEANATPTFGEYINLLCATQADQERQGRDVVRVQLTVIEMRRRLTVAGWPNTPDRRAAIVALAADE